MTSPRAYDGVGYYAPSFASDTPIYDSLVAERGVPQIAPINVPAALPPAYDSGFRDSGFRYDGGYSPAPALPVSRLALGPGPSSPSYGQQQYQPSPFQQQGMPMQPVPVQGLPMQRYPEQYGAPQQQPNPVYQRPVAPVAPLRPVQYQEQYPQQQRGGYQGF
jgi:hypothetical protein